MVGRPRGGELAVRLGDVAGDHRLVAVPDHGQHGFLLLQQTHVGGAAGVDEVLDPPGDAKVVQLARAARHEVRVGNHQPGIFARPTVVRVARVRSAAHTSAAKSQAPGRGRVEVAQFRQRLGCQSGHGLALRGPRMAAGTIRRRVDHGHAQLARLYQSLVHSRNHHPGPAHPGGAPVIVPEIDHHNGHVGGCHPLGSDGHDARLGIPTLELQLQHAGADKRFSSPKRWD